MVLVLLRDSIEVAADSLAYLETAAAENLAQDSGDSALLHRLRIWLGVTPLVGLLVPLRVALLVRLAVPILSVPLGVPSICSVVGDTELLTDCADALLQICTFLTG